MKTYISCKTVFLYYQHFVNVWKYLTQCRLGNRKSVHNEYEEKGIGYLGYNSPLSQIFTPLPPQSNIYLAPFNQIFIPPPSVKYLPLSKCV